MNYFCTFKIAYLNKSEELNSEVYAEIRIHSCVVKNVRVVKETETRYADRTSNRLPVSTKMNK